MWGKEAKDKVVKIGKFKLNDKVRVVGTFSLTIPPLKGDVGIITHIGISKRGLGANHAIWLNGD